jgi:hypothetical protein
MLRAVNYGDCSAGTHGGFIILDYVSRFMEGGAALGGLSPRKLKHKTTVDGPDNA